MEETITLEQDESGMWIITHHESDITTQGSTRIEALLMLVDAMSDVSYFDETNPLVETLEEDPLRVAARVFVPSREQEETIKDLF